MSIIRSVARNQTIEGNELIDRLLSVNRETLEILAELRQEKTTKAREIALKAIGRLEAQLELQARLCGQLRGDHNVVNFTISAETSERVAAVFLKRHGRPIDTEVVPEN
jgi:hypothetical protein